jgi:metal-sulfur cluster biosynthetic enzyme
VSWWLDNMATTAVPDPTAFVSGSSVVFATVANGTCTSPTVTISLTVTPGINIAVDVVGDVSCNSLGDGSAQLTISGGMPGYNYDWNVDALDGLEDPTGLAPGNYSVTITDMSTCVATASFVVNEPAELTLACAEDQPVSTVGGNDGSAALTISGGTAPFAIDYTGPVSGSATANMAGTTTIDMLEAGTYNVTITDDNGCMTTCTFTITDPACALSLDIAGTNLNCAGDDSGAIELTVSGAVGNVTFDWNIDALDGTEDPSGLAAGTYEVTVTDEAGCTASTSVTLTEPAALMLSCAEDQPVSTVGGNDGSAALTISGGTAPFAIDYTGPVSGSATANMAGTTTIDMLQAGTYNVTITDDNGCMTTCTVTITDPACALSLDIAGTNLNCAGDDSGAIELTVSGAVGNVTFDWNVDALDGTEDPYRARCRHL